MADAAAPGEPPHPPEPAPGRAPPLDGAHRQWPETNCYVDLWLTLILGWKMEPRAMLGFLAAAGFAGDQFTFAKPPHPELEALYGARTEELTLYRPLESHLVAHANAGRPVLLEADAWWLPDSAGTDYRRGHTKTTVAVLGVNPEAARMSYVHNRFQGALEGEDYRGVLWQDPAPAPGHLPPFAEVVERRPGAPEGAALAEAARDLLRRHLARAPADPFAAMADALEAEMATVRAAGPEGFHLWAFSTLRQAGAAHELLGIHAAWLGDALGVDAGAPAAALARISAGAKAAQFRAARAARGGDVAPLAAAIRALGPERDAALDGLRAAFGA